ncbi:MAG: hypothetical protein HY590_01990 [Candidatus Omnitrophica bacterium]|nr:hypothetical protein [Candidatus Omnitrophota bacterium]
MSLKEFHIVFMTSAVLLCLGFSYWGFVQYHELRGASYVVTAILSLVTAMGLVIYEISFIKKTKTLV